MVNYDEEFKKWVIRNLKDVRASLNEEWLQLKIRNFIEKHNISSEEEIIEKIKTDDVVASFFAKDPSKQGIHEKTVHKYLMDIFGYENVDGLPKAGANAKYVVNGEISHSRPDKTYKSIDFIINYEGYKVVCSHKYTNESGGAQDNQRNDLMSFMKHANNPDEKIFFVALADGRYYSDRNNDNLNRISALSSNIRVFATTTHELKSELDRRISQIENNE